MKWLMSFLFAGVVYAQDLEIKYTPQVTTSMSPFSMECADARDSYKDEVESLEKGYDALAMKAIANDRHCKKAELEKFLHDIPVQVEVKRNALRLHGMTAYNQTVVTCTKTVSVRGKILKETLVGKTRVEGDLVGEKKQQVEDAVKACQ